MLTKKQVSIFGACIGNIFKEYSYKEIKELSGEKSNNAFQQAMKEFKRENLVLERNVGTSRLYTINIDHDGVYSYLSLVAPLKLPKQAYGDIRLLKNELDKYTPFYSLVVFGSYADQTYNKKSDLDIAVIIKDYSDEKAIKVALNKVRNKALLTLDTHIIPQEELLEMLTADYENLGKEIARKNLPMHNINIFYKIIKKGIDHGFKY